MMKKMQEEVSEQKDEGYVYYGGITTQLFIAIHGPFLTHSHSHTLHINFFVMLSIWSSLYPYPNMNMRCLPSFPPFPKNGFTNGPNLLYVPEEHFRGFLAMKSL